MKYYRLLEKDSDEVTQPGDVYLENDHLVPYEGAFGTKISITLEPSFRPVELRGPDELTDEEKKDIKQMFEDTGDIVCALNFSDELRARPRETEKEKWINKEHEKYLSENIWNAKKAFSEIWDAAYEQGRMGK